MDTVSFIASLLAVAGMLSSVLLLAALVWIVVTYQKDL